VGESKPAKLARWAFGPAPLNGQTIRKRSLPSVDLRLRRSRGSVDSAGGSVAQLLIEILCSPWSQQDSRPTNASAADYFD
jgi:hypothetical protein